VDDSEIQRILRHSNVAVTQAYYIKTTPIDAVAAMRKLSGVLDEQNQRAKANAIPVQMTFYKLAYGLWQARKTRRLNICAREFTAVALV